MKRSPRPVGVRGPRGSRIPRGIEGAPYIIVDEGGDEAPHEGSVPVGPQGGQRPSSGEPEAPMGPKAPTEPCPETEVKPPKAGTAIGATATQGRRHGKCLLKAFILFFCFSLSSSYLCHLFAS